MVDETNVWSSLPFPLSDIVLQEVVPFLEVKDLIQLGAVSKIYQELLGPRTVQGKRIVGLLVKQEAKHYHQLTRELLYMEQLPTIGNLSVQESLQEDALLVARLRTAASRRRALILLSDSILQSRPSREDEDEDALHLPWQVQEIVFSYRSKSIMELSGVASKHGLHYFDEHFCQSNGATDFVCVNRSGVDVYCRSIDQNGKIRSRPRRIGSGDGAVVSFVWTHDTDESPANVCLVLCRLHASFALSWEERGAPFCIYQARRGWHRIDGVRPCHAIAVLPGGVVQELSCDSTCNLDTETWRSYDFVDRQTGQVVPHAAATTGQSRAADDLLVPEKEDHSIAKDFAKRFYGLDIPPFLEQLTRQPSLYISAIGEAVWHEGRLSDGRR